MLAGQTSAVPLPADVLSTLEVAKIGAVVALQCLSMAMSIHSLVKIWNPAIRLIRADGPWRVLLGCHATALRVGTLAKAVSKFACSISQVALTTQCIILCPMGQLFWRLLRCRL